MAKPQSAPPPLPEVPAPRRRTGRWVGLTIVVLAVLQVGPSLYIVFARDLTAYFDWPGYLGYQAGSLAVPLGVGCLGLLFRRNPGLGYCMVACAVFAIASFGSLTR